MRIMKFFCSCVVVAAAMLLTNVSVYGDEDTGTISGTIKVYKAKAKTEGSKSFKDVIVYLEKVGDNDFPPPAEHAKLDQKGLVFIPHVLAIQKGTTVDFHNSDNDKHNIYFLYESTGKTLDLGTWNPGDVRSHTFDNADSIIGLCKLHLEMAAYIAVLGNPFFTVAVIDGETQQASYTIKNVPPGKHILKAWHKKLKLRGGDREVVVESGKTTTADIEITRKKYAKK